MGESGAKQKAAGAVTGLRWALGLVLAVCSSGATCIPWTRTQELQPGPIVFHGTPTLGEVIAKVNANTVAIKTLQADSVRISAPGVPTLKATLAVERPRRFRLQGDFLLSREIDIGSNDELFWLWGKNWTGALVYARHDQLSLPQVRQWIPWEPQWFLGALGLVYLDPGGLHQGPFAHGPGAMEVHTQLVAPTGDVITQVTVIHAIYGWILQQQLRNDRGQVLVVARLSRHRFYPEAGVTLPDVVEIEALPGTARALSLRLDMGGYRINETIEPPDLFAMPRLEDAPPINLADPQAASLLSQQASPLPVPYAPQGPEAYRPQYRGYSRR
jgi:hypothetical protein